jgi:AcrR family transcriptional regulator
MVKRKITEKSAKKERKVARGPIRNKERTRQKLINAVGKVFAKEGHASLTAVKIASTAKVDRKLIYLYFGSLDNLIDCYFKENDFWVPAHNKDIALLLKKQKPLTQKDILAILKGQLDNVLNNKAFRKSIQWEISEKNKIMRKVSDERERVGQQLFELATHVDETAYDLPATLAIQIAGIYYLALHAKVNGSTFCGIDINRPEGLRRIENALAQILGNVYGGK